MQLKHLLTIVGLACVVSVQATELKELRIGTDATYEPFEYKSPDGKVIGFEVDLANAICAEMKRSCVFVESPWDGIIPSLLAKKFDVIISGMTITDERRKTVSFSNKMTDIPYRIIVKRGSGQDGSPASLKGKKIGVQKATTEANFAEKYYAKAGAMIMRYESTQDSYLDLSAGRVDALIGNLVEMKMGFLAKPEGKPFEFAPYELKDQTILGYGAGAAMRQSDTKLMSEFNAALKTVRANGTYKKIADKYFDFDVYGK
ncbi:transporter substrate-binding domain-containing protein [Rhodoferax aquaticus]|uniref:Transporter substrate-binding domain-containing protein n=1 Tax=Rhodoferax aquaticus TaxID=2527691 RepID=A0A515ERU2_9BURK|nr:transporter substrate-binding domain-containing protein [Rhodoferax aquaticus]QDL55382.1 transporter substrate-binding domain-containing protein [Rhodoferax aquaticus]